MNALQLKIQCSGCRVATHKLMDTCFSQTLCFKKLLLVTLFCIWHPTAKCVHSEDAHPSYDLQSCSHVQFRTTSLMKWFEMGRWNEWCDFDVALWDFISSSASFKVCKSFFKAGPTCSCFISKSRLLYISKRNKRLTQKGRDFRNAKEGLAFQTS